jgi:cholesterol transport system auxiliary component
VAPSVAVRAPAGPTLMVSTPRAWPGYDQPRIAYLRHPLRIDYYALNEWADSPPRMLEPLLITAIEASGRFRTVVSSRSGIGAQLRLDTEIVRLQHEFLSTPSQGRVILRAQLIDLIRNRVLGTRNFEAQVPAPSEDAEGGVTALNSAVQHTLAELVAFCNGFVHFRSPAGTTRGLGAR